MNELYTIVSQVPRTIAVPGGVFSDVIVVTFTTKPSGQVGKVTIPVQAYNAQAVADQVSAQAQLLEQIQAL